MGPEEVDGVRTGVGLRCEGEIEEFLPARRCIGNVGRDGRDVAGQDGAGEGGEIGCGEGMNAAEHFVGNHGERPKIPTAAEGASPQLLRRHVAQGAEGHAGEGVGSFVSYARKEFGDAEIGDLDDFGGAGADQEDIFGLEIAVDEAAAVSGFETGAERLEDLKDARGSEAHVSLELLAEGDALEEFHDEEGALGRVDAEIVHGDEIGMREAASHAAFAAEAIEGAGIGQKFLANHFDGNIAIQR